jgi:hypothetical protein
MKLASGAELKLLPAPFPEAKALLQAFLEEAKGIDIKGKEELPNVLKNVFCSAFSSPKLDAALAKCMERCQYRGLKITEEAFEAVENRQDYLEVCYLVAEENLKPFTKSLYAKFVDLLKKIESIQA